MLSAEELVSWRDAIRVWEPVGEVSELAETMAALDPAERAQVRPLLPDSERLGGEIERLLSRPPR
jgi:hypothetical protein